MLVEEFDIVVVGAGHAGCEAALATARLGRATALLTLRRDRVAAMSCNPAIGGLGKSQIVREIDALGGEMGRAADAAAIHFRRLNRSKGPAVRARRVQCDMGKYHQYMLQAVLRAENLTLIEGTAREIGVEGGTVGGVLLSDGRRLRARAVVLTTGTFLRGKMHVGMESQEGGRLGDPSSLHLSGCLESLGLRLGRLKTGTPPRLDATTVDLKDLQVQPPDEQVLPFSHEGPGPSLPQVACHATRTNPETHQIIRAALHRSPLFSGIIQGRGPRYCPSIEDKVVRFPDRDGHQVILEPTDLSARILYPNGISTSLPRDVQAELVRSIEGLSRAQILDYGYAVEYDYVLPSQLDRTLQVRSVPGLFLAGQINGTSGYEEAAGQGLLAGINAKAFVSGTEPMVLGRGEAYIGVMVDDLVTRGTLEPYRMFSSRAEFRLLLREDNAADRLAHRAVEAGLIPQPILDRRRKAHDQAQYLLSYLKENLHEKDRQGRRPTLHKVLKRPEVVIGDLAQYLPKGIRPDVLERVEVEVKYEGYVERQLSEVSQLERMESRKIPVKMDYLEIPGISRELADKLTSIRPTTFGQASRIDGMTPAALSVLSIWMKKLETVPRGTEA